MAEVIVKSRTMSKKRGLFDRRKNGRETFGETSHEADLASRFCLGCQSNNGTDEKGFPICKKDIHLDRLVVSGLVTINDLKPYVKGHNCERA